MMNRRELMKFGLLASTMLVGAACVTSDGRVGVPVNVTLPPEVIQIIGDAQSIIDKGKKLLNNTNSAGLISQAEGYVKSLKSGKGDLKSIVGTLAPILGDVSVLLPSPYNLAAGVLVAVAKAYVGHPVAGRLAMTPAAARAILQN